MMGWGRDDWSWWAWLLMSLGMVAFWALVAWTVVTIVRMTHGTYRESDAETILKERFARGEIDADEYRDRLNALREVAAHTPPSPPN